MQSLRKKVLAFILFIECWKGIKLGEKWDKKKEQMSNTNHSLFQLLKVEEHLFIYFSRNQQRLLWRFPDLTSQPQYHNHQLLLFSTCLITPV